MLILVFLLGSCASAQRQPLSNRGPVEPASVEHRRTGEYVCATAYWWPRGVCWWVHE